MPRNIKQKKKQNHSIKQLDRNIQFTSRIKRTMIDQYQKARKDKSNKEDKENSNATNYAITRLTRISKGGTKETSFVVSGLSKNTYQSMKLKLAERKPEKENKSKIDNNRQKEGETSKKELLENNQERNITTFNNPSYNKSVAKSSYEERKDRLYSSESDMFEDNKAGAIKEYQREKLIKERQNYRNIKEHSYKNNGIKTNNNPLKVKTRESMQANREMIRMNNIGKSNELMKKSNLQKVKENGTKVKRGAKKVGKTIVKSGKKVKDGLKGARAILTSGGGLVLLLIIIVILVAGVFKSMFGIFFADETATKNIGSISIGTAISKLDEEVDDEIESIKNQVSYDKAMVYKNDIYWKDIISVYAVIATNRGGVDVANMDEKAFNKLKEIFYDVVDIDYEISTYYVTHVSTVNGEKVSKREARTRLEITVNCMTFDEMVGKYGFSVSERNQALLLLSQEYDEMWNTILNNEL